MAKNIPDLPANTEGVDVSSDVLEIYNDSTGKNEQVTPQQILGGIGTDLTASLNLATVIFEERLLDMGNISRLSTAIDGDGIVTDDSGTAYQLTDADGTSWIGLVNVNDWAFNDTTKQFARVLEVAAHVLYLSNDIFSSGDVYYIYSNPTLPTNYVELTGDQLATGTADTDTVGELVDSSEDFTTVTGLSVGDYAWNLETGEIGRINDMTNAASGRLGLEWDAFPNGTEKYILFSSTITISNASSILDGEEVIETNVYGYFYRPGLSSGNVFDDAMQRITGNAGVLQLMDNAAFPNDLTGVFSDSAIDTSNIRGGTGTDEVFNLDFNSANSVSPNTAKTSEHETKPKSKLMIAIKRIA